MRTITITATIDEKRRIMIDLPDDIPLGELEIELRIPETMPEAPEELLTTEAIRARLVSAGLVSPREDHPDAIEVSEDELKRVGLVFADKRSLADLISEDREERM